MSASSLARSPTPLSGQAPGQLQPADPALVAYQRALDAVREEQRRRELERERARIIETKEKTREECRDLLGFVRHAWSVLEPGAPFVDGWHLHAIADHLTAVSRGQITRLLINVPPGMMKSLMSGVFWPAWEWGPDGRPELRVLGSSYSEAYAIRDSAKMRNLVRSEWYQEHWGDRFSLVKEGEKKFENDKTGWREGVPFSRMTGGRGDRVLIDDPHSTEGAESELDRARALRIFRESVPTRLNSPEHSAIVVIMQRLHERDVSGLILAEDLGYTHLCLPMEFDPDRRCRTSIGFEDPRTYAGELLFPERFPRETVDRDIKVMGGVASYAVSGQFQQRPVPREGGIFITTKIEPVATVPAGLKKRVRAWDFAGSTAKAGTDPDWTAGVLMSMDTEGFTYIEHAERFRENSAEVKSRVLGRARLDARGTKIRGPQDPGQAGKAQAAEYARALAGYSFTFLPVTGDKVTRATPFSSQVNAGNVRIVYAGAPSAEPPTWVKEFLAELEHFPAGAHDDQVDAAADAYNELAEWAPGEGLREYYRQEAARVAARESGAGQIPEVEHVRVKPPAGVNQAYGADGSRYSAGPDGFMWMPADAARALESAGFVLAPEEPSEAAQVVARIMAAE